MLSLGGSFNAAAIDALIDPASSCVDKMAGVMDSLLGWSGLLFDDSALKRDDFSWFTNVMMLFTGHNVRRLDVDMDEHLRIVKRISLEYHRPSLQLLWSVATSRPLLRALQARTYADDSIVSELWQLPLSPLLNLVIGELVDSLTS